MMSNNGLNDLIYLICSLITTILCLILKIPQLIAIFKSKSSRGLSIQSLVLELWAYLTMFSYSYANSYPLSMYSEYPILTFQDILIILLILRYNNAINIKWISALILICSIHVSIATHVIPLSVSIIFIQLGNPIGWYSKGLQLWTIVKNKDAGQVSCLTWSLCAVSCAARLITLWLSIMDRIVFTSLVISLFLNSGVAIAAHIYRPKIKKE